MALPTLTPEKRAEALAKAAAARAARAELKAALKAGTTSLGEVLERAESEEVIAKTKVEAILTALPGIGKVHAREVMTAVGIADTRRIGGLGERQRAALLEHFGH